MRYCGSEGGLWGGCQDVATDTKVSEDVYFVGCADDEAEAEEELVATIKWWRVVHVNNDE